MPPPCTDSSYTLCLLKTHVSIHEPPPLPDTECMMTHKFLLQPNALIDPPQSAPTLLSAT